MSALNRAALEHFRQHQRPNTAVEDTCSKLREQIRRIPRLQKQAPLNVFFHSQAASRRFGAPDEKEYQVVDVLGDWLQSLPDDRDVALWTELAATENLPDDILALDGFAAKFGTRDFTKHEIVSSAYAFPGALRPGTKWRELYRMLAEHTWRVADSRPLEALRRQSERGFSLQLAEVFQAAQRPLNMELRVERAPYESWERYLLSNIAADKAEHCIKTDAPRALLFLWEAEHNMFSNAVIRDLALIRDMLQARRFPDQELATVRGSGHWATMTIALNQADGTTVTPRRVMEPTRLAQRFALLDRATVYTSAPTDESLAYVKRSQLLSRLHVSEQTADAVYKAAVALPDDELDVWWKHVLCSGKPPDEVSANTNTWFGQFCAK